MNVAFSALVADIQNSCDRRADYAPEQTRQDVLLHCKNLETSRRALLEAQQVLLDNLVALRRLSWDDTLRNGKTLEALQGSLANSGLDSGQISAAAAMAKMIADARIAGYRQRSSEN